MTAKTILCVAFFGLVIIAVGLIYDGMSACQDLGGVYLRSVFWFECIRAEVIR